MAGGFVVGHFAGDGDQPAAMAGDGAGPPALGTGLLVGPLAGVLVKRLFGELTGHGPANPRGELFDVGEGFGGAEFGGHGG